MKFLVERGGEKKPNLIQEMPEYESVLELEDEEEANKFCS